MTRKEWIKKNLPAYITCNAGGGVIGCPASYNELIRIDPSVLTNKTCKKRHGDDSFDVCDECWNMPLLEEEGNIPSDKVEIQRTIGEPHIKDVFYTVVRYPIGNYWLYTVGDFSITSMSAINDTRIKCVSFDYNLQYEYTFFYDLITKAVSFTPDIQYQAKKTPNLDRSLFLEWKDAVAALEKWTGNVFDRTSYVLVKKGEQK